MENHAMRPAFVSAAAIAVASLFVLPPAGDTAAQQQCAKPLERQYDAFSAGGDVLGKVIANVTNEDGEPLTWVLETEGPVFGLGGRKAALPGDAVEIAAGRALVRIRDESALEQFPTYAC
ncbi:MAG: hypothetical protein TEF_11925 [Rhizobiales bacterium NRL2]|jgi:hypothetical protein|nr:MAG: hypothetical protein TEF_11925 [Rhizobiales bacterium NRL2]